MVFARSYCGGLLLGVVLAVACECEPPLFNVCLPCDACILGGFSGCFLGFFLVGFSLFRLGAVRAPLAYKVIIEVLIKVYFKVITRRSAMFIRS